MQLGPNESVLVIFSPIVQTVLLFRDTGLGIRIRAQQPFSSEATVALTNATSFSQYILWEEVMEFK